MDGVLSQAAPGENLLYEHGASEEIPVGDAGHGDNRQQGVPQRVPGNDTPGESTCPRVLDEIAEQGLGYGRSRHFEDGSGIDEGQREGRERQVREGRPEDRPISAQDAVDRVEPCHLRRRKEGEVDPANRGGNDVELPEQQENQEKGPPEIGHRAGEHAVSGRDAIGDGSGAQRGQHAERKGDGEG